MVALSIVEAEYIAAGVCATQAVWLKKILGELQHQQREPTKIFCDNKSVIALTKNLVFHGHSKHMDIKFYYIHDLVKDKEIAIEFCSSEDLTKPLKMDEFLKVNKMLGMMKLEDLV